MCICAPFKFVHFYPMCSSHQFSAVLQSGVIGLVNAHPRVAVFRQVSRNTPSDVEC